MEIQNSKVQLYEHFVNDKLRNDLGKCLNEQEKIYSEIAEYLQVKDTIEKLMLSDMKEELKVKVDLGCNFYAKAVVQDLSFINIAIGYGFFLQMKFDEALKFIEKKVKVLNKLAEDLTLKTCEIKANIKFVLEGLREIQHLEPAVKKETRDIF